MKNKVLKTEADKRGVELRNSTFEIMSWTAWSVLDEIEDSRFYGKEGISIGEDDGIACYRIPNMTYDDVLEFANTIEGHFLISAVNDEDNGGIENVNDLVAITEV